MFSKIFWSMPTKFRSKDSGVFWFDWIMTLALSWLAAGLFLDVWAHAHITVLETFFTSWHAVFYFGFCLVAGVLFTAMFINQRRGLYWLDSVPKGYWLSALGVLVFSLGGVGDMFWHIQFGVETNIEATFSPTHLLLAVGMGLMFTGPFRSAWHRTETDKLRWTNWLPVVLSIIYLVSLTSILTAFSHPIVNPLAGIRFHPSGELAKEVGVIGIVVTTSIITSTTLLTLIRWTLPPGTLTIFFTFNAAIVGFISTDYPMLLVAGVGISGVFADLLAYALKPSKMKPVAFRVFAFAVPGLWAACYFIAIEITDGIWWAIHLWGGAVFLSAITGWLISYLLIPPLLVSDVRPTKS